MRQPVVLLALGGDPSDLTGRSDMQGVLKWLGRGQLDGEIVVAIGLFQELQWLFLFAAVAAHQQTGLLRVLRL